MKATNKTKTEKVGGARPYNRYNIYFILERENIIISKGGTTKWSMSTDARKSQPINKGYENVNLPPLPSRFAHLDLPDGWFIPGQTKKRPHRRTHGVATFRELARSIAASWKTIDNDTLAWCSTVEMILKQRQVALTQKVKSTNVGQSKSPDANIPKQVINVFSATRPEEVCSKTTSPIAICKDYSQAADGELFWDPSEDIAMFGEVSSQMTDSFASLVASIHAPELSRHQSFSHITQNDPCFDPDFEVTDKNFNSHPTPMNDNIKVAPWDNQWAANVSDDDIRKMWYSQ